MSKEKLPELASRHKVNVALCELFGIDYRNLSLMPAEFHLSVLGQEYPLLTVKYRIMPAQSDWEKLEERWKRKSFELREVDLSRLDGLDEE